ncbi:MAG TPA: hypothetical protein DIW27_00415 [Cytophagales bacterium]|nr:hypothetical protein [Cytophagales bacterium]
MILKKNIKTILFKFVFLMLFGCLEPYSPTVIEQNVNLLVVDGFLNASTNSIQVKLSRTLPIYTEGSYTTEKNATVVLEEEAGPSQPLYETVDGTYVMQNLNLNNSKKYRLFIRTEFDEYASEYITLKQSPSLDEVTWEATADGVKIYVSAHDPTNQTRYYQWKFWETWQYTADYFSAYTYKNDSILYRNSNEFTYICYKSAPSDKIILKSTTQLNEDVVGKFPIHLVPRGSRKVASRYNLLVQQRALDEAAYNYYVQLQKTTETVGGLFDPLPSQVTGNMHNVNNPSEPVIGYFMGGSVQEKMIFINRHELPSYLLNFEPEIINCRIDTIASSEVPSLFPQHQLLEGYPENPNIEPYEHNFFLVIPQQCADCRLKDNGTITRPVFW